MSIELKVGDIINFRGASEAEYRKLLEEVGKQGFEAVPDADDFPPMAPSYFGYSHEDGVSTEMECAYLDLKADWRGSLYCKPHVSPESIRGKEKGWREIDARHIIAPTAPSITEQVAICDGLAEVMRKLQVQMDAESDILQSMLPEGMMLAEDSSDMRCYKNWRKGDVLVARNAMKANGKVAAKEAIMVRDPDGSGKICVDYDNGTDGWAVPANHFKFLRRP